jgi:hypothetical protein
LIFPIHKISREELLENGRIVDREMRELARRRGLAVVEPAAEWYGRDPIHILRARREQAWRQILAPWGAHRPQGRLPRLPSLWRLAPAQRWILGLEERRSQPCARLEDGTSLALW